MSGRHRRAVVVGSFNAKKAEEMAELLRGLEVPVRLLAEFAGVRPVSEDGETFAENSRRKALGLARQIIAANENCPLLGVVADDSGLEVDALDGRPGVYSARYAGEDATDSERVRRILHELGGVPAEKRSARFRCHIALADAERILLETEGTVEGRIAFEPAGNFGFGYDPVFIPLDYDGTFAELGAEVKHRISHRATALRLFRDGLVRLLREPCGKAR